MSINIERITTACLEKALDASVLQHQAIASNIANANVKGYKVQRTNFEEQMDVARSEINNTGSATLSTIANIFPTIINDESFSEEDSGVKLDVEMAKLSENVVRYQTLLKGLNRHFSIMTTAINEGKK